MFNSDGARYNGRPMAKLPRYISRFDLARIVHEEVARSSVVEVAARYGVSYKDVHRTAFGLYSTQIMACKKILEALGYNSRVAYYAPRDKPKPKKRKRKRANGSPIAVAQIPDGNGD